MPLTTDVPELIQSLLTKRRSHVDAVAVIDATLARVAGVLSPNGRVPNGQPHKVAAAPAKAPATSGRKRRRSSKFAMSANDSILGFVKTQKNPSTQDIKKHWMSEGRGGGADNTLSMLTKAKKLKRTPLGNGMRGSRYALA